MYKHREARFKNVQNYHLLHMILQRHHLRNLVLFFMNGSLIQLSEDLVHGREVIDCEYSESRLKTKPLFEAFSLLASNNRAYSAGCVG